MFPTSRAYAWLAVGALAFAVYVSLIPFELRPTTWDAAWAEFRVSVLTASWPPTSRTNFLANILLFVPAGFFLMGALMVDRAARLAAIPAAVAVVAMGAAVSLLAEFLQVFEANRIPAADDVAAQTIGGGIGLVAWTLVGPELTRWVRAASQHTGVDRVTQVLTAYAAGWVFVNVAPFDITLDMGDLVRRIRDVAAFDLSGGEPARRAWDALAATLSAVPLGMLGLVGWTGGRERRHAIAAAGFGAALVAAVEVVQIVIRSHSPDVRDALFGWLGVVVGVGIASRVFARSRRPSDASAGRIRAWALAAAAAWCVILVVYHWLPYDFTIDPESIRQKLARMSVIPFAGYYAGSDLNAFNDVLVKLTLSVPLGAIAALAFTRAAVPTLVYVSWAMVAGLVFGVVETGQLFLPSRTADPTDVFVGVCGSLVGLWLGRWLAGPSC